MERQDKKRINMFNGKVYGFNVSEYGLENGYLDYFTLAEIVGDRVLNNNVLEFAGYENWELVCGEEEDKYGNYYDIYQYYIISYSGYRFLENFTDELVFYNEALDMYLWGITHFGTSWDYVLTDIKLMRG